jgi:hypothetical protein
MAVPITAVRGGVVVRGAAGSLLIIEDRTDDPRARQRLDGHVRHDDRDIRNLTA